MENNKSSMTALVSAFGRAYHSLNDEPKIFNDYLARELITDEEYSNISKHMADGIHFFNPEQAHLYQNQKQALNWVVQTQIAPTPIARSTYTEEMLENAIQLGIKQYIILGAGFDTFVFRRPDLLDRIKVFEVDHPATQRLKLERIEELGWELDPAVHHVAADFVSDNFSETLLNSGYNPTEPSFFSWLGVTYYLTREEITKMLKEISNISPKGSTLIFDYPDHNIFSPEKTSKRVQAMVNMANMAGEPMKTGYKYGDLESDLESVGLLIYEHLTPAEIQEKYFKGRTDDYRAFENINYVLAVVNK